jgi:hypothetical protein
MIAFVSISKKSQIRVRAARAFRLSSLIALLVWTPVTVQTAPLKLVAWPWNAVGDMPEGLTNIAAVAASQTWGKLAERVNQHQRYLRRPRLHAIADHKPSAASISRGEGRGRDSSFRPYFSFGVRPRGNG